jgi:hypothetical protein
MVLAEVPALTPVVVSSLPYATILRNKGIEEGTSIVILSRSSYGTLKLQIDDSDLSETFIGTTIAEKIHVNLL